MTLTAGVTHGIRVLVVGTHPEPAKPADDPWWVGVIMVVLGLVLAVVGVVVMKYALEVIEWLVFARRRCPMCGARRWSWGFTKGFGL